MKNQLEYFRQMAITATTPGPNKWQANTELISWFRSCPVEIITALQCGAEVIESHGGLSKTRMVEAFARIPMTKPEEHAA